MATGPASLVIGPAHWFDARPPLPSTLPAQVRRWIRLGSSMTRALQRRFGAGINVAVRFEGRGRLSRDESQLLGRRSPRGQVREVVLGIGERDLLAARTVHASRRLAASCALASLGTRPLGELLFATGKPRSLQRQYARVKTRAGVSDRGVRQAWARRTVYVYERQRLLVTEVFLPAMVRQAALTR